MGDINVGSVGVTIVPDARGFNDKAKGQILPQAEQLGKDAGKTFSDAFEEAVGDPASEPVKKTGEKAKESAAKSGDESGGAFGDAFKERVKAAVDSLPKAKIDADSGEAEAKIDELRAKLEELSGKKIGVDIDADDALAKLEEVKEDLKTLDTKGRIDLDADAGKAIAQIEALKVEIDRMRASKVDVEVEVESNAGSFAETFRGQIEAAVADLPKAEITADSSDAEAKIQAVRAELEDLGSKRLGVDVDVKAALEKLAGLRAELDAVARDKTASVDIRTDAADALAKIDAIKAKAAETEAKFKLSADDEAAKAKLDEVKAKIDAIDGKVAHVKVAVEKVGSAPSPSALGEMFMSSGAALPVAGAGLGALAGGLGALAPLGIGLGGFAAAARPIMSQISNVYQAQQQVVAARAMQPFVQQQAGAQIAMTRAQAGQAAAQGAAQVTMTRQGAAESASQSAAQVAMTQAQAQQAAAQAADQQKQSEMQLAQAQTQLTMATQQAAMTQEQSLHAVTVAEEQVVQAENQLEAAQSAATLAQRSLTDARLAASRALQDYQTQLADGALQQQQDALAVQQAQLALQQTMADPRATQMMRESAQLAYQQAVQQSKDQSIQYQRLQQDAATAAKYGVAGNEQVMSATQALTAAREGTVTATQNVANSQFQLTTAQQQARLSAEQSAAAIVSAQDQIMSIQLQMADAARQNAFAQKQAAEQITLARQQSAFQQQQSAEQIAQTEQQSAFQQQQAAQQVAEIQRQSTQQVQEALTQEGLAMQKLSPIERQLVGDYDNLKAATLRWRQSVDPTVVPALANGMRLLTNTVFPALTPAVNGAAIGMQTLETKASAALAGPFWSKFSSDMGPAAKTAITGFGIAGGNVMTGFAGLLDTFIRNWLPRFMDALDHVSGRFAAWGAGVGGQSAVNRFMTWLFQNGPSIAHSIEDVAKAAGHVVTSLAGFGVSNLTVLGAFANLISALPPGVINALALAIGSVAIASKAAALGMGLWKAANEGWAVIQAAVDSELGFFDALWAANPIGLTVMGVVAAIAALIAIGYEVANHWGAVSGFFMMIFHAIGDAAIWLWQNAFKPAFDGIATAAMWLWNTILKPAFDGIALAGKILAGIIAVAVIAPIIIAFHLLEPVVVALWQYVIQPIFTAIAASALGLWHGVIEPMATGLEIAFQAVGAGAMWLWSSAFQPAFQGIATAAMWLWQYVLQPVWQAIEAGALWMWHMVIEPVGAGIKAAFGVIEAAALWMWHSVFDPVWQGIQDGANAVIGFFKTIWTGVEQAFKAPIQWIVNLVYNDAIVPVWNDVVGTFGGPRINPIQFATGGEVPMAPGAVAGRDSVLGLLTPGEHVLNPRQVAGLGGHEGVLAVLDAFGVPGYASGGPVPPPGWVYAAPTKGADSIPRIPDYDRWIEQGGSDTFRVVNSATGVDVTQALLGTPTYTQHGAAPGLGGAIAGVADAAWSDLKKVALGGLRLAAEAVLNPVKSLADSTLPGLGFGMFNIGKPVAQTIDGFVNGILDFLGGKDSTATAATTTAGPAGLGDTGAHGASAAQAQAIAAGMLGQFGWGPDQMPPLISLWNLESGWNYLADNASSGAYGIPQSLPGSKMASAGADWATNPATQIRWGLGYIHDRYGSPAGAWNFEMSHTPHWYDDGGWLPQGVTQAVNTTGRPEAVLTGEQWDAITGKTTRPFSPPGPAMHIENFHGHDGDPNRTAEELVWLLKARG